MRDLFEGFVEWVFSLFLHRDGEMSESDNWRPAERRGLGLTEASPSQIVRGGAAADAVNRAPKLGPKLGGGA